MSIKPQQYLQLVHDSETNNVTSRSSMHYEPIQSSLIQVGMKTLVVCTTDGLDEKSFIEAISKFSPQYILDLRKNPRFDFGTLNRKKALALFEAFNSIYVDLAYLNLSEEDSLRTYSQSPSLKQAISDEHNPLSLVVLIDPNIGYRNMALNFVWLFRELTKIDWELIVLGPYEELETNRSIIFISHANPEDNEFTLWLQAQLVRNGYEVWSDLMELKAGEYTWDIIEDTIRNKAAKVIAVSSKVATTKSGVLDEVSLAVSIERAEKISNFVIPIKIGDLAYIDLRANIARKNVIDFSKGWALGFQRLLVTLKKDKTPKTNASFNLLSTWWNHATQSKSRLSFTEEKLISNQYKVVSLPKVIYYLSGSPSLNNKDNTLLLSKLPLIPLRDRWLSFYSPAELSNIGINNLHLYGRASLNEFITNNSSLTQGLRQTDIDKLVNRILNRHWEHFLISKGLILSPQSQPSIIFLPNLLIDKNQVQFTDLDGIKRRRKLVGFSPKRQMYWHLGLTGRFSDGNDRFMRIRVSIVFSKDGMQTDLDKERGKDLRRRFCKNWWNDRWRTLQIASMHWLADGKEEIEIMSGEAGVFSIKAQGVIYNSPVSIIENESSDIELDLDENYDPLFDENEVWEVEETEDITSD